MYFFKVSGIINESIKYNTKPTKFVYLKKVITPFGSKYIFIYTHKIEYNNERTYE